MYAGEWSLEEEVATALQLDNATQNMGYALSCLDMSRLPLKIKLSQELSGRRSEPWVSVWMFTNTKDPFTGDPIVIQTLVDRWGVNQLPSSAEVADKVREALHSLMAHEVDECFFVKGEQRYNPHMKNKT